MKNNKDLINAARVFGTTLREMPAMQEYLQAEGMMENDPSVQYLETETERAYTVLVDWQQAGKSLSRQDVNRFTQLREALIAHPTVARREESLRMVKALCEHANEEMSSILSMDYTLLVNK